MPNLHSYIKPYVSLQRVNVPNSFLSNLRLVDNVSSYTSVADKEVCRVDLSLDLQEPVIVGSPKGILPIRLVPEQALTSGVVTAFSTSSLTDWLRSYKSPHLGQQSHPTAR